MTNEHSLSVANISRPPRSVQPTSALTAPLTYAATYLLTTLAVVLQDKSSTSTREPEKGTAHFIGPGFPVHSV